VGFEFASLPYDSIASRMVKTHAEIDCFKELAGDYFDPANARLKTKEYERLKGDQKLKMLKKLAQNCADELPKFKDYKWEEVVLDALSTIKIPRKSFNTIFGHEDEEQTLYPSILRHLKETFNSYRVFDTSRVRSKFVRFADFTAVKEGILSKKILSFDAKTKPAAFDHFLNQANDFQRFSDQVFLIATPGLILQAGKKYDKIAFAESGVVSKLRKIGTGLFVLDKTSNELNLKLEAQDRGPDKNAKSKAFEELRLL
jgi:hypothetical protein